MDSKTFLDLLKQSRLLSDEQIMKAVRQFSGRSTEAVASSLVSEGLLTPFQVKRLTAGQTKGLVLGQYRILDELGSGGFGQVFRALHTVMGRTVAVKLIAPQLVADPRARNWFKREVLAVTQLCHPNIVMAYDANEADGLLFLVMEFVDGADLESVVWTQGPLAISAAYELMRQAGLALQYAHERGTVHRDIKPANLLVPRVPTSAPGSAAPVVVKVTDFGLARLQSPLPGHPARSMSEQGFLGTPDYVSPEQGRNAGTADIRSDLYSLGCTFYYALAGQKPFIGNSVIETLMKHLEEEPAPLETLRPEVPSGIAAVVRRLMAKDPAKRFQTPAELVTELTFLASREGGTPRPGDFPTPFQGTVPVQHGQAPVKRLMPVIMPGYTPAARKPPVEDARRAAPPVDARAAEFTPQELVAPRPRDVENTPTAAVLDLPAALDLGCPSRSEGKYSATSPAVAPSRRPAPFEARDGGPGATNLTFGLDHPTSVTFANEPPEASANAPQPNSQTESAPNSQVVPWPDEVLRAVWYQWREVVEDFALADGVADISETAYRTLHRELLGRCRAQMAAGGDQHRALRLMESLVEPWLSPDALAAVDPVTLVGLLRDCDRVGQDVFGVEQPATTRGWVLVLALVLVVGGLYYAGHTSGVLPNTFSLKSR